MSLYLGLDTSNYTTSAAVLDAESGKINHIKKLLPVKEGSMGLRQSDAVFHHVRQLPEIFEDLRRENPGEIAAVAASDRPQQEKGSYMPCFLVGAGAARELASALCVPLHFFTHQQGHVAAALYGSGKTELAGREFLAFHVSGGTTDALYVCPEGRGISCRVVARSLDLKAGQLVDRVGGLLGLPFPAGPALEKLAMKASGVHKPKPVLRNGNCHLSGVENQCAAMVKRGEPPEEVALFCLKSIEAVLCGMTEALLEEYGSLPLIFAGGVMSNTLLRRTLEERFDAGFAPPSYSADNAAGVAWLCARMEGVDQ